MSVKRVEVVVRSERNVLLLPQQSCDLWMPLKENSARKKNLLFKCSLWFGYRSIANFSWSHKEHCFVLFCFCIKQKFFPTLILVFLFLFSLFSNITRKSWTVQIVFVSKLLGAVIISLLFKLSLCQAKIHIFGVWMLLLCTCISNLPFDNCH